ncbi:hypothetical protein [Nocardia wallacei]|uniref:hypothetical protein n=1 Tax=Nocardia wallacei TaxID=480035 RepID=UPI002456C7A0|nr:hypothetical protein [Nocardia wallacei]
MGNTIVFAARPYYDEDDERHVAARIAAIVVGDPNGSHLERQLASRGIPATSCVTTIDSVDDRNVMVVEYRAHTALDTATIEHRTRAAVDAVGATVVTDEDLMRAKACAQSLLDVSVSGLSEFVDAVCGFVSRYGRHDLLDEFRHRIRSLDRGTVTEVIRDLYVGEEFFVECVGAQ